MSPSKTDVIRSNAALMHVNFLDTDSFPENGLRRAVKNHDAIPVLEIIDSIVESIKKCAPKKLTPKQGANLVRFIYCVSEEYVIVFWKKLDQECKEIAISWFYSYKKYIGIRLRYALTASCCRDQIKGYDREMLLNEFEISLTK